MPYLTSEYCIIFGAATQSRTFVHVLAAIFIPKCKGDDDMAKRKKHPRLPNGYGQIRFLGKNRRNPYGVYPPAKEEYENGQMKPQKAQSRHLYSRHEK